MGFLRSAALAAALLAGVVAADKTLPSFFVALAAGAAGSALIAAAWFMHRRAPIPEPGELMPRLSRFAAVLVLAGVLLAGFADLGLRSAALDRSQLLRMAGNGAAIEGRLATDPYPSGRAEKMIVRTDSVDGVSVRERLSLRYFGETSGLQVGDRIRFEGKIRALDENDRFDAVLVRRGLRAEASVSPGHLEKSGAASNPALLIANHLRSRMRLLTDDLSKERAGLVLGLTIGDDALIPEKLRDDMRTTGLSHLTAVSGANVAIVLGALILITRALRVSRRTQILLGLVVVGMFVVVTRWEPSVLRAAVMASLALVAYIAGRRADPSSALFVAFFVLVSADPMMVWSIGFQLSFAATGGILLLAPSLRNRLAWIPRWAGEALAVGIGAQAGVTPLLAFHFGTVPLVSPLANLAAYSLVAPITVLGLVGGLLGSIWVPLGELPIAVSALMAGGLSSTAGFFAGVPLASISVPAYGPFGLLILYTLLGAGALWLRGGGGKVAFRLAAAGLLSGAVTFLVPPAASSPPDGLTLTFFDVGQGESALVESPAGVRMLIDGGPDERFVAARLDKRGLERLDVVVLSHDHADHANGLRAVMDKMEVRLAIGPGVGQVMRGVEAVGEGDLYLIGDVEVSVLGPARDLFEAAMTEDAQEAGGSPINDASVVLRIAWRQTCVLFTGDIEENGQRTLIERHAGEINCPVLKAPHHGSPRILEEFVQAVSPRHAVVSVGLNEYGHPSRRALSMFERAGARVMRTDRMDDIVLEVRRDGSIDVK